MPLKVRVHAPIVSRAVKRQSSRPEVGPVRAIQPAPAAHADRTPSTHHELLQLQRTLGNQATGRLLARTGRAHPVAPPVQIHAAVPSLQGAWDVAEFRSKAANIELYNELLRLVGWTGSANNKSKAAARLQALADKTDSAAHLKRLLEKVGDHAVLSSLLESATPAQVEELIAVIPTGAALQQLLTTVGGAGNLMTYYRTITTEKAELYQLLKLETDLTLLTQLKAAVGSTATLILVLKETPADAVGRGAYLQETIRKAGSWPNLQQLATRYTTNVGTLRRLLDVVPPLKLKSLGDQRNNTLVKGKGEIVLELLHYTDFDRAAAVIEQNPTATADRWKILATTSQLSTQAAGAKVHPRAIRFTQATVTNRGAGYSVRENIKQLREQPNWEIPAEPIRVFHKTAAMNNSIPARRTDFGDASPVNLENGQTYTLDNRRLYAYQEAGRDTMLIPQFVPLAVVRAEAYKMTTTNFGVRAVLV